MDKDLNRRDVLTAALGAGALLSSQAGMAAGAEIGYRTLGKTGEKVSMIGLGGFHVGMSKLSDSEATKVVRTALDRGLNFLDNSWDYHDGGSEVRVGKALQDGYRKKAFVMTKVDGRTKEAAAKQIDESLSRLKVDHIDLMQHHEILRFDDPDRIFAEGGAHEAFLDAKKAGKIRYIGFTGHKDPRVHMYMLEVAAKHGFHFDTVQMPLNVMDAHFRSFAKMVVPEAVKQGIAVLGMKPMGSQVILKSNTVTAIECLHYALNLPTSVVITGVDSMQILDQAFEAAKTFKPMSNQELSALLAKTADAAKDGRFELFKTTAHFDSTAKHPDWLGDDSPRTKDLTKSQS